MKIMVKLFATLRENRFKVEEKDYPFGTRVTDILANLEIIPNDIAICLVNGRDGHFDTVLKEGDTVSLFPPVGGG